MGIQKQGLSQQLKLFNLAYPAKNMIFELMLLTKVAETRESCTDFNPKKFTKSSMASTVLCALLCSALFVTVLGFDTNA